MSKRGPSTHKAPAKKKAKRLNVRAALHEGSLLTGVTLTELQVTLQLAAAYNQTSNYHAINDALYHLYKISLAFQVTFEAPIQGTHAPILQLKENHGYVDKNAILSALKAFATPQKPLKVKAALSDGSLLTGVTLTELQVTLQLAAVYTQASYYRSINKALYNLYQISSAFQATFERPKLGINVPVLQLRGNHGYADEHAILSALKSFAEPQKQLEVKDALSDGSLLTGVALADLQVTLHVAAAHSQASDYKSVNQALYDLYQISPAFQASFEAPKQGTHAPILQLKENHSYADENDILSALKAFAASQKPLKIKAALKDGSLLTGVTLTELQVTLQLAAAYTQASVYQSINKALYDLYRISSAFQTTFEQPKLGVDVPVLQLKENHGYADEHAILSALETFAAPQKRLNVKAALSDGSLLTGVTLADLQVTLQLAAAYTQASDYMSVNKALYDLYQISSEFQATFERPKKVTSALVLRLKAGHGYGDENAILSALKAFAAPQKQLNVKAALSDGSLLTGVTLQGLQVILQLAAAYNQANGYRSINKVLYDLYQISLVFQETFERPKRGTQAPVLRLKENHGYADAEAVLAALIGFTKDKIDGPLSENVSSEAIDMAEQIPNIPDALLIEAFPQAISNFLINSSECDLLALLGEQLSDNQQSYLEVATSSIPLTIENVPPPFQPLRDVDVEANRVAQTVQEVLGEDNDHDYDFEKDMRKYFLGKK